jgi:hypothetical protein
VPDLITDKLNFENRNSNIKYSQLNRQAAQKLKPFYNNFLDTLDNFSDLIINKNNLNESNKDVIMKHFYKSCSEILAQKLILTNAIAKTFQGR